MTRKEAVLEILNEEYCSAIFEINCTEQKLLGIVQTPS